ncbi:hypothetical protein FRC17_005066 [Serendipita sp. 399]|nr:hypothetical protein FRC17_005066 [Serendipita sp. 399]
MRCSRKDNLQQHYRTHLVVNPRRANAQSMLNAASTAAGASQDATNDPEAQEASAIHKSNNNIHNGEYADPTRLMGSPTDLKPIPSDASQPTPTTSDNHGLSHLQTSTSLVDVNHHDPTNGPNPDRDWSLSPPPPLSSAYDYWYAHGCLPHTVRNPASVSGSAMLWSSHLAKEDIINSSTIITLTNLILIRMCTRLTITHNITLTNHIHRPNITIFHLITLMRTLINRNGIPMSKARQVITIPTIMSLAPLVAIRLMMVKAVAR